MVVVLPAPFGPTRQHSDCSTSSILKSLITETVSKLLQRFLISRKPTIALLFAGLRIETLGGNSIAVLFRTDRDAREPALQQADQSLGQEADDQDEECAEHQQPGVEERVSQVALSRLNDERAENGAHQGQPAADPCPDHHRQAERGVELRGRDVL